MIRPGKVYMADFPQAGPHPVIVISRENLNRGSYTMWYFVHQRDSGFAADYPIVGRSGLGSFGSNPITANTLRHATPVRSVTRL